MPIACQFDKGNLAVLRVSGELGIDEYQKAQADLEAALKRLGSGRGLIILEDFTGWERAEGWEDVSFVERNDPFIKKLAIVGDEKWRDMAYTFTLKGLRPVPIEFFTDESAARQWLDEVRVES